jgi:MFS transporter, DHA3 family, macrolide efflux protein
MRTFFAIFLSQGLVLFGQRLTGFALGIWILQRMGSTTLFALVIFVTILPDILVSPVAGALVDARGPVALLLASAAGSLIVTLLLAGVVTADLGVGSITALAFAGSVVTTPVAPAVGKLATALVPPEERGRASALRSLAVGMVGVAAPPVGGFVYSIGGLVPVLAIDAVTALAGIAVLAAVRARVAPPVDAPAAPAAGPRPSLGVSDGWRFLRGRAPLVRLLAIACAVNLVIAVVDVLAPPLVLGFAGPRALGYVLSAAGVGMLAGGALVALSGGPRRRARGIVASLALLGGAVVASGLRPSALLVGAAAFVLFATVPVLTACTDVLWQRSVPVELQGRVFAVRIMTAQIVAPVGFLVAAPLAEHVAEPLMAPGGRLGAGLAGALLGAGPGRGTALVLELAGLVLLATAAFAALDRPVRALDGPDSSRP